MADEYAEECVMCGELTAYGCDHCGHTTCLECRVEVDGCPICDLDGEWCPLCQDDLEDERQELLHG